MSDKAITSMNVEILPKSIRNHMTGELNLDIIDEIAASSGDGWVYAEKTIAISDGSQNLIEVTDDYIKTDFDGVVAVGDKIPWIVIKHTGTVDGHGPTNNGILFCADGGTAAYNLADGIYLSPGEMIVLKLPNTTVDNFHCIPVKDTNGKPTAAGTGNVFIKFAAILTNVG